MSARLGFQRLLAANPAAAHYYIAIISDGRLAWRNGALRLMQPNPGSASA